MKKSVLFAAMILLSQLLSAQKQVQHLPVARIGIFKNGTCFVKREATVPVTGKTFFLKAPEKVLTGTYWIAVGKESGLHSVVVRADTFKVTHAAKYLIDYLKANTGQVITLYGNADNPDLRKLTGKLAEYDPGSLMMKVITPAGKTVVASASGFDWFESSTTPVSTILEDSVIAVAKVNLTKPVDRIITSTISLEKGVQWFPSYLFTQVNDKEAKLDLKATIANGATEYLRMPVDIIIGSPEMFYGKQLDPVCIDYLSESLLDNRYDNGAFSLNYTASSISQISTFGNAAPEPEYEWTDEGTEQKEGQKAEDLYYYQLGVLDLEKNSRVIVPVMSATVSYTEIYTADLAVNSPSLEDENPVQTYHSYIISNNSGAPFTTGAVLVLDKNGQPLAQAQLNYTPVKGTTELQLSKAVDVQVKNEEVETGREKSTVKRTSGIYYDKVTSSGVITITNYKDKTVKLRVTKNIDGNFASADNGGKSRKTRSAGSGSGLMEVYWEVDVEAGGKLQLKYEYYVLK